MGVIPVHTGEVPTRTDSGDDMRCVGSPNRRRRERDLTRQPGDFGDPYATAGMERIGRA